MADITLTGTIVDSDSVAWANAQVVARLVSYGSPEGTPTRISTGAKVPVVVTTYLDSTGVLSLDLAPSNDIYPVNTQWQIEIQPNVSTPVQIITPRAYNASADVSSIWNGQIKAPRITAGEKVLAYAAGEIEGANLGDIYTNTSPANLGIYMWSGAAWVKLTDGGGGGIGGSGTSGFYPIFTAATTLADGTIDSGVTLPSHMSFVDGGFVFSGSDSQSDGITIGNSDGFSGGPSLIANSNLPIDVSNGGEGLVILADDGSFLEIRGGGEARLQWYDSVSHNFASFEWVDLGGVDTFQIVGDALQIICNGNSINFYGDGGTTPALQINSIKTDVLSALCLGNQETFGSSTTLNIDSKTSFILLAGLTTIETIEYQGGTPPDGMMLVIVAFANAPNFGNTGNILTPAFTLELKTPYIGIYSADENGWYFMGHGI